MSLSLKDVAAESSMAERFLLAFLSFLKVF